MPFTHELRPSSLEDLVGNEWIQGKAEQWIEAKDIGSHKIFHGPPGVGKTTLARILAEELDANLIEYDCSATPDKVVRELPRAMRSNPISSRFSLIVLDEFDNVTPKKQRQLRKTLEDYQQNRVILIVNDINGVIDAIKSRAVLLEFEKCSGKDIELAVERAADLKDLEPGSAEVHQIVEHSSGDVRYALNLLEDMCI